MPPVLLRRRQGDYQIPFSYTHLSNRGTGGMVTKLHAAEIAMAAGIPAVIMNGARPSRLYDLMEGQALGTLFVPHSINGKEG